MHIGDTDTDCQEGYTVNFSRGFSLRTDYRVPALSALYALKMSEHVAPTFPKISTFPCKLQEEAGILQGRSEESWRPRYGIGCD
ncbi:hypothetical protein J6590_031836 [Homalodisca vitripennis]|nr:hypothetical protein J6590_031836 [Homalodisca vitripennis]